MNNDIEIFGQNVNRTKRVKHGLYIAVNMNHRNAYMSRDLVKLLFGDNAEEGKINIIHSKIENNWYVAASNVTLFNGGFDCVKNDPNKESVFRINGAADVFTNMIQSLSGSDEIKRYNLGVSRNYTEYDGMKLHLITIL